MTAQRKTAPKRTKKTQKRTADKQAVYVSPFHKKVAIGFSILSIILVAVIFYISLAQVKIYITPKTSQLSTEFDIELLSDVETTLAGTNILPGSITTSIETITEQQQITEGSLVDDIATGEVVIYNNYSRNQPLVKTTRLETPDGKLFRINETVTVPAGGSVVVEAYADQPGADFNIPPTTFTIPGLWEGLQQDIYAESTEQFTGGQRLETALTDSVITAAADTLIAKTAENYSNDATGNEDVITLYRVGEPTWDTDAEIGSNTDTFTITISLPITTIRFQKQDLEQIATNNLIAATPSNDQFVSANFDSMKFVLASVSEADKSATLRVSIDGRSITRLDPEELDIGRIEGMNKQELTRHVTSLPEVAEVNIVFIPAWLSKVPPLEDHVYIEVIK